MICKHIRPKWGDAYLEDIRPALVQDRLRRLVLVPKYKGHIRSLMYRLFEKAMLWALLNVERNPMDSVEVKGTVWQFPLLDSFGQSLQVPDCP